jgi:hypothetical protein
MSRSRSAIGRGRGRALLAEGESGARLELAVTLYDITPGQAAVLTPATRCWGAASSPVRRESLPRARRKTERGSTRHVHLSAILVGSALATQWAALFHLMFGRRWLDLVLYWFVARSASPSANPWPMCWDFMPS